MNMLSNSRTVFLLVFLWFFSQPAMAQEDTIELDTAVIKGNTELPKILYVVPWQDAAKGKTVKQKLVLHSLFGDLFEPFTPPSPE